MLDKSNPVPGRVWYMGRWRTPEEVDRVRAQRLANNKKPEAKARRARALREKRINDPEWAERDRARQRGRYVPRARTTRLPDEIRTARAAKKRIEAAERRRERARVRAVARANAPVPVDVPSDVRRAYGNAAPHSAIKLKYPTWDKLRAGARRGDFDRWRV